LALPALLFIPIHARETHMNDDLFRSEVIFRSSVYKYEGRVLVLSKAEAERARALDIWDADAMTELPALYSLSDDAAKMRRGRA
jgi:hypothetical protein